MSNLHRLRWIDEQIRANHFPNCSQIAEEFEISIRQASRDIEYLRYSMNAPILYSVGNNGYYYEDTPFVIPSLFITRKEKDTLFCLAKEYRGYGSSQSIRLAELFEKISYQDILSPKCQRDHVPLDVPFVQVKTYLLLTEGLESKQKVEILYVNAGGGKSKRIIHPYNWINRFGFHYIVAFCEKKEKVRLFRLDRIHDLVLCKDTFLISDQYDSNQFESERAFNRRVPFKATVLFDKSNEPKEFEFYRVQEFIGSLISNHTTFIIIKPKWLKEVLLKQLESLLHNHSI